MPHDSVIFEPNYSDSLKARFCKQYIPRLKEFLTDFDISQASENEDPKDSLGMGFLVKAYNEMENKEQAPQLKANCKWKIEGVTEKEIYEAIEEFYAITAWKDEIDKKDYNSKLKINEKESESNSVCGQRDKLLEFLFQLKIEDRQANIADTTMFAIADYYGFRNNAKQLGNLYQPYEAVAYAYDLQKEVNKDGLYDFRNVLRLFPNLRNAIVHQDYDLKKKIRYHEFIIFTYVGYIFACRRIWKAFNYEKITTTQQSFDKKKKKLCRDNVVDFFCPNNLKLFTLPKELVEINIGSGPNIDVSCKDKDGNTIDVTTISKEDNRYSINISRYERFTITINDGIHEPLSIEDELDYNAWFYCYKVNLPKEWYPSSQEYETLSEGTKQLIASVSKYVKEGVREDIKECIKQQFAELQPLIKYVVKEGKRTEELNNILEKLTLFANGYGKIEEIQSLIEKSNQTIFEELKKVSSKMEELQGEISTISGDVKKVGDEGEIIIGKLSNWERNIKLGLFIVLIVVPIVYAGYNFFANNINTNIYWLRHEKLYWAFVPILICLTFWLTNSWDSIKKIKTEKGKLNYWVTGVIALILFGSPFLLRYQTDHSLVENYDFIGKDSASNQCVAQYLEDYLPNEEELVRSNLALYYVDIVGNLEKASEIANPMLEDMKKFKDGSIVAMYVLYCQKEFPTLDESIERFGDIYSKDDPAYCDLKGAMLVDTLYGNRDIERGEELLLKACEAGSANAYYNLGFLYSCDMSTYEAKNQGGKIQEGKYNLPLAIKMLKVASDALPRASLLLGDIYADLQMTDSAFLYYKKAITETKEGGLYRLGEYKMAILCNKYGIKPNDFLFDAQLMKYPPALMFSSIKMDNDINLINSIRNEPFSKYFYLLFSKRDHKRAVKWYEDAVRNLGEGTLEDMGIYQYIPPVALNYIYMGEKEKALTMLQETRKKAKFDDAFVNAVELLIGSANVKPNYMKGMQLMHESAESGCLYSKLFCLYKETEKELMKTPTAYIDTTQFNNLSKEIPFAHVMEALLFIRAGKLKLAENAAHMAMWKKHPAGAYVFEFMPTEYYIDFENSLKNGANKLSNTDLFKKLRIQEMALRSTWSNKDNCLVLTCVLDKVLYGRLDKDFTDNFKFWAQVAIENKCRSSQVRLLRIYEYMINNGYKDTNTIIDPLLRCVLHNFNLGRFDLYPNYNEYIILFLKYLRNKKLFPQKYLNNLYDSYRSDKLEYYWETVKKPLDEFTTHYISTDFRFIDDFSLITEFTYIAGPYSFRMGHDGPTATLVLNPDYYQNN